MDEAGLKQLYDMSNIHDFTFMWHEALPAWQTLRDTSVLGGSGGAADPASGGTISLRNADLQGLCE